MPIHNINIWKYYHLTDVYRPSQNSLHRNVLRANYGHARPFDSRNCNIAWWPDHKLILNFNLKIGPPSWFCKLTQALYFTCFFLKSLWGLHIYHLCPTCHCCAQWVNYISSVPHKAATTFAFSSIHSLIQCFTSWKSMAKISCIMNPYDWEGFVFIQMSPGDHLVTLSL